MPTPRSALRLALGALLLWLSACSTPPPIDHTTLQRQVTEAVSSYTSVWRQELPGVWRVIFDKGCNCP